MFPTGMHFSFEKVAGPFEGVVTCVGATQTEYIRVWEPPSTTEGARKTAVFPVAFVLNPFWWVKTSKADGNMKLVSHSVPCEGMELSVDALTNHRTVMKGEVLSRCTAKSDYLTVSKQVPKAKVKAATAKKFAAASASLPQMRAAAAASAAGGPRDKKPRRKS
jgi:hypothetical protein